MITFLLLTGCLATVDFDGGSSSDDGSSSAGTYPIGGWPKAQCDLESTGNTEGEVANDVTLEAQTEEQVNLHSFCDKVVYMVFSAEWCGACQSEAATLEAEYQSHKDDGLMVVEVMTEKVDGSPADVDTLNTWADEYGLTLPVLADPNSTTLWTYASGGSVGLPFTVVLDRGMVVHSTNYPTAADAIALLGE